MNIKKVAHIALSGALVCSMFSSSVWKVGATTETSSSRVDEILSKMTTKQKIEQKIMPDFRQWKNDGESKTHDLTEMNDDLRKIMETHDFGGIILFGDNTHETDKIVRLIDDFQKAATKPRDDNANRLPLLVSIDNEGGTVFRVDTGTAMPGNMAIGATKDKNAAYLDGKIIGREEVALGINNNFGPDLDTNSNPLNPVINIRSISSDPNLVADLGVEIVKGIQDQNVAATAKHFPGHGDTSTDSHTGLPTVDKSYEEIKQLELVPFQAAIDAGIDMIMTAHIAYPQIAEKLETKSGELITAPATLSRVFLTDILRKDMGFEGVVVTDSMTMQAIVQYFGDAEAVVMAFQAGVDIALKPTVINCPSSIKDMDRIIDYAVQAVEDGRIDEKELDASVRRILELKEKRGILDLNEDNRTIEEKIANAEAIVGCEEHRRIERIVAEQAITVIKNDEEVLPFNPKANEHVLLIGAYENEVPGLKLGMRQAIADGKISDKVTYEAINYNKNTTLDSLKPYIDKADYVITITEMGDATSLKPDHWITRVPTEITQYANEKGIDNVLMSIHKPYDVANFKDAKAIVAAYGSRGMDPTALDDPNGTLPSKVYGANIPAAVNVIFGKQAQGTLPVDIPSINENHEMVVNDILYPIGHGLKYQENAGEFKVNAKGLLNNDPFTLTVQGEDLQQITKHNYRIELIMDNEHFELSSKDSLTVKDNVLVFDFKANEKPIMKFDVKPLFNKGAYAPIKEVRIYDYKDRSYLPTNDVSKTTVGYLPQKMTLYSKDRKTSATGVFEIGTQFDTLTWASSTLEEFKKEVDVKLKDTQELKQVKELKFSYDGNGFTPQGEYQIAISMDSSWKEGNYKVVGIYKNGDTKVLDAKIEEDAFVFALGDYDYYGIIDEKGGETIIPPKDPTEPPHTGDSTSVMFMIGVLTLSFGGIVYLRKKAIGK